MDLPTLTPMDWHLAIAAHVYELDGAPIMSDMTFDTLSKCAEERGCKIPCFAACTGMWVQEMDRDLLQMLHEAALTVNMGKDDVHLPGVIFALEDCFVEYEKQWWQA
jgi:hypothetical protein